MFEGLQGELERFEVGRNNDGGGKGSGSGCIEIWVKGNNDNKSEIDRKRAKKIEEAEECVEKILRGSNE
jgi:hypothetical protein